ncbi:D-alanyl-D-alanine carboxypeptidase/D-alanyl-D-alanine-endopeptidase [Streptomyces durbertensis]|uniref:D-alanyl-D-alanine carboxypeptidase/D-alanyl-D-alanine-endopeptidase n=1 Tax=Streptomyces durbertensis TaxID=2448886 RepID=A0ABR6EKD5_9ACTN|nr:D-alanyl-D-alanine carboxypeptidase/D-alanyl-D-alanine-endopeptidase [Streptomyces durbertensis]MBB1245608.1 D-alanyl-D-alanine carboxypeptidase/D-alanyl-D-alanine-endopeptidase [Streptomyces durbertensis]
MNRWVRSLDAVDRPIRTVRLRWRTTPPRQRRTWQTAAGAAAVGLAAALTAVAATGPWDSGQRKAERAWAAEHGADSGQGHTDDGRGAQAGAGTGDGTDGKALGAEPAPSAEPVLAALGDRAAAPTEKGLDKALRPLLRKYEGKALGKRTTVSVVDVGTGRELFSAGGGEPVVPASTIKLATAAAALSALGGEHRIPTRAVWDAGDKRVVLVGGGDPTLTESQLEALAADTAKAVRSRGLEPRSVGYDVTGYDGPQQHPIGVNDNIAPLTPLMLNAARVDNSTRGPAPRAANPAADAAVAFATMLRDNGVDTDRTVKTEAPAGWNRAKGGADSRALLAEHRSAPLAELVERMLLHSDNDLAEALARQTAMAAGKPADFAGTEKAVKARLAALDLPVERMRLVDGSGLSRGDRLSTRFLATLLARAADERRPELRPLLTGMPVAGFTGTLGGRYDTPDATAGAGLVRAKTGTLTGVNSLAGTVVDADGRLLSFAFVTTGTADPRAAQNALDTMAATVARCGCR